MKKEIWIPESETRVTVQGDKVWVSTEMIMNPKKIDNKIGFTNEEQR